MIRAIILTAAALLAGCAHCQVELSASYRYRDGDVSVHVVR
jgi:hypothetical protein